MHLRIDPNRRAAASVGVCVVLVAVLMLGWVLMRRPSSADVAGLISPPAAPSVVTPSPTRSRDVVVDVAGRVLHPGVYSLPDGSRVIDAVSRAGGPAPGVSMTQVNLAAVLTDGQQIVIGAASAAPVAGSSPGSAGPLALNSATLDQLETLPGVGPVLAQNILDYRTAHGRFDRVDQLNDVTGIGPAKFAALRARVTV